MFEEHLLAIEDDEYIALLISEVAKEAGYYPHILCNSSQLSDAYLEIKPQVVVLDILMPELDGFDVLNFLAQQQSQAKIVIVSGSHEYRDMAEKMGAAHGLSIMANIGKPFRVTELRLALQEIRMLMQDEPALASVS